MSIERDPRERREKQKMIDKIKRRESKRCREGIKETDRTYEGVPVREAPADRTYGMGRMRSHGSKGTGTRKTHKDLLNEEYPNQKRRKK